MGGILCGPAASLDCRPGGACQNCNRRYIAAMSTICVNERACDANAPPETALLREEWVSHPNYPGQVLLVGSHNNFRRVSRYLVAQSAAGGPVRPIGELYMRWRLGMRSHEAYEEGKLYPFLRHRFCAATTDMERGHRELHGADEQVRTALTTLVFGDKERADETLHRALVRHDLVLQEHLDLEEELVVPLLLALSPQEFGEYYDTSIDELLKRLERRVQANTGQS